MNKRLVNKVLNALSKVQLESIAKIDGVWTEVMVAPQAFVRDGEVFISAEHGDGAADYYGEGRGGYPWVNPKIEKAVKSVGCYIEWQNPGCLAVYPS